VWLLLLACAGPGAPPPPTDRALHAEALELIQRDPAAGAAACEAIAGPSLRADCAWAAASALAGRDVGAAAATCDALAATITDSRLSDECWFVLAEAAGDVAWCARAGAFVQDCRMHLFTEALRDAMPRGTAPAEALAITARTIAALTLDPGNRALMHVGLVESLRRQRPLDRASCDGVGEHALRQKCFDFAARELNERLNRARDRGDAVCEGELPADAAFIPSPPLDRILAARRADDLCDPARRRAPPLDAPGRKSEARP